MKIGVKVVVVGSIICAAGFYAGCDGSKVTEDGRGKIAKSGGESEDSKADPATVAENSANSTANDPVLGDNSEPAGPSADDPQGGADVPPGSKLKLTWSPSSESYLLGYKIFVKEKDSAAEATLVADINLNDAGFNALTPAVTLAVKGTPSLEALAGKEGCFSVKSKIDGKESVESTVSCLVFK
jgi:hypothetical protein